MLDWRHASFGGAARDDVFEHFDVPPVPRHEVDVGEAVDVGEEERDSTWREFNSPVLL